MDDARPTTRLGEIGGHEETFAESLQRKERELVQRIAAVRGMLTPLEQQLGQVRTAMQAIGLPTNDSALSAGLFGETPKHLTLSDVLSAPAPSNDMMFGLALGVAKRPLTIKQMIIYALRDHFKNGATPAELRDYMNAAYRRDVDRNSISPQLARLREEGYVEQVLGLLSDGRWQITDKGRQFERSILGMLAAGISRDD